MSKAVFYFPEHNELVVKRKKLFLPKQILIHFLSPTGRIILFCFCKISPGRGRHHSELPTICSRPYLYVPFILHAPRALAIPDIQLPLFPQHPLRHLPATPLYSQARADEQQWLPASGLLTRTRALFVTTKRQDYMTWSHDGGWSLWEQPIRSLSLSLWQAVAFQEHWLLLQVGMKLSFVLIYRDTGVLSFWIVCLFVKLREDQCCLHKLLH